MSYLRIHHRRKEGSNPSVSSMSRALDLTRQADELPPDPNGLVTAEELRLRREAHLALCMTPEFRAHRKRIMKRRPEADFREEHRRPSGDLVRALAAQQQPEGRVHVVAAGTFSQRRA